MIEKRTFARNFVLAHLVAGPVMTMLLLFHELFALSVGVLLWYLLSIGVVAGMMRRQEWCRPLLAFMFLLLAAASAVFITNILPTIKLDHETMLPRDVMPLWGALVTLGYFVAGLMVFVSNRLKRATTLGFALWG